MAEAQNVVAVMWGSCGWGELQAKQGHLWRVKNRRALVRPERTNAKQAAIQQSKAFSTKYPNSVCVTPRRKWLERDTVCECDWHILDSQAGGKAWRMSIWAQMWFSGYCWPETGTACYCCKSSARPGSICLTVELLDTLKLCVILNG